MSLNLQRFNLNRMVPGSKLFMSSLSQRIVLAIVVYIVIALIFLSSVMPERYDLKEGEIAVRDIKAPKDIIDQGATQKEMENVIKSVNPKFDYDEKVYLEALNNVTDFFKKLYMYKLSNAPINEKVKNMEELSPIILDETHYKVLLEMQEKDLKLIEEKTKELINKYMKKQITDDSVENVKLEAKFDIDKLNIAAVSKDIITQIIYKVIKPNMIYNQTATELAKMEAIQKVKPVTYKKGQIIIKEGEVITKEKIELLKSLGLLGNPIKVDFLLILGSLTLVLLLELLVIYYLSTFQKKIYGNINYLAFIVVICMIFFAVVGSLYKYSVYLIPMSALSFLIGILVNVEVSILVVSTVFVLMLPMIGMDLNALVFLLTSSVSAILRVKKFYQRYDLALSGLLIGITNMISIISIGFIVSSEIKKVLILSIFGFLNGIISIIFAIGTLPFWETTFGILTPIKLLELSNPNQPLLKRLLLDAPGTYHHSILVANLAEAAAEDIGANGLLARVGAYYHDVGKLKRPYFFKENQFTQENPHDKIVPNLSVLIITSHVKDGVEIAEKYKLPRQVIDIINEHHGTTLVTYFYQKAIQCTDNCKEEYYRYPGPKPSTKEAAIVMLADSVEAAVRSLSEPTEKNIENMVRKIIRDRLDDGQLDNCDLTLKDLEKIANSFMRILNGMFHDRIEYPDVNLKNGKEV